MKEKEEELEHMKHFSKLLSLRSAKEKEDGGHEREGGEEERSNEKKVKGAKEREGKTY